MAPISRKRFPHWRKTRPTWCIAPGASAAPKPAAKWASSNFRIFTTWKAASKRGKKQANQWKNDYERKGMKRRSFLKIAGSAGAMAGLGDLGFLSQLRPVTAAEARLDAKMVQLHPEIEPVVRLIENTPRERLL